MKLTKITAALTLAFAMAGCTEQSTDKYSEAEKQKSELVESHSQQNKTEEASFKWQADRFADIRVLRYQVPGFEELALETKELLFYLYKAALSGRDMTWDQNYKYNLTVRHTLEAIIADYSGDKTTDEFAKFIEYTKRVWFSNGIHHHYMSGKIMPEFSAESFALYVNDVADKGNLPLNEQQNVEQLLTILLHLPLIFMKELPKQKLSSFIKTKLMLMKSAKCHGDSTQN